MQIIEIIVLVAGIAACIAGAAATVNALMRPSGEDTPETQDDFHAAMQRWNRMTGDGK